MSKKKDKKKKNVNKKKADPEAEKRNRKKREIQGILIIALGIFLVIAMFSDLTGAVGAAMATFLRGIFGLVSFVLPFYLILYGVLMLSGRTKALGLLPAIFMTVLFFDLAIVNSIRFIGTSGVIIPIQGVSGLYNSGIDLDNGGVIGMVLAGLLVKFIGKAGAYIFFAIVALISIIIISDRPYAGMGSWKKESEEREAERRRKAKEKAIEQEKEKERLPEPEPEPEPKRSMPPEGYIATDLRKTEKAIRKSGLSASEKNILHLVNEDMPLGKGEVTHVEGFGLDGDETGFEQPGMGLAEGYETGEADREEYSGYTGSYENFAEVPAEKTQEAVMPENTPPVKKEKVRDDDRAVPDRKDFNTGKTSSKYRLPPIDLLKAPEDSKADLVDLAEKTKKLEETLKAFNVDARVVDAVPGPAVTRYEIEPSTGVKVSRIVNLSDDIALNLRAKSIRIEAPIPGKAAVGIEIENDKINMVRIREIIGSKEFKQSRSKISFSVGKDISGKAIVGDLKSMPHLLIAGSTGSGKSVCINSIIASILYKAKPDEVKLVLVDPKAVELANYNGIPHLLIPVVTDAAKAAAALNWAVAEMNDRYKKFAEAGVRDLNSYNEHISMMDEGAEKIPQVVIIIDELADLMMASKSQVEDSICRLAQMARAAGMHLIVATQRPSVDVITGVIKANIPSRIAFAVSSQVDSRTILDMAGAEKLVGKGDMLYNPLGMGKPVRVQGCFISDEEVNALIDYVKSQCEDVTYSQDAISSIEKPEDPGASGGADSGDKLLEDCIEFVVHSGQASVSMLQRRFRIGYNRAARIMDILEERGIVGPADGARPRKVLISEEGTQEDSGE